MEKNKYNQNYPTIKDFFKSSPYTIIIYYLLSYVFVTLFVSFIVCGIYANNNNLTMSYVFQNGMYKKEDFNIYYTVQAYTNFFTYLIMFILLIYVGRTYLKEDLKIFKNYKKVLLILGVALLFSLISSLTADLSNLILTKIGYEASSANEDLITKMFDYCPRGLMFLSIVVFAPLVEELVFRKSVFLLTSKWKSIIQILFNAFIFTLPHMISTTNVSINIWVILFFTYYISGVLLAVIYYFINKNIYSSLSAHAANNLVAFLKIVI